MLVRQRQGGAGANTMNSNKNNVVERSADTNSAQKRIMEDMTRVNDDEILETIERDLRRAANQLEYNRAQKRKDRFYEAQEEKFLEEQAKIEAQVRNSSGYVDASPTSRTPTHVQTQINGTKKIQVQHFDDKRDPKQAGIKSDFQSKQRKWGGKKR